MTTLRDKKLSLPEILSLSPHFGTIVHKIEQLSKLNRIVHQKLDQELAKHCRVANLRDGILVLTTTSPTYGHRLRFEQGILLTLLRADPAFCHLKSIQTRVQPPLARSLTHPSLPVFPIPVLSNQAMTTIEAVALNMPTPKLQQALLRLASRGLGSQ